MELGPLALAELNHTATNSKICSVEDIISSWLDIDEIHTPTFPQELHDIHMLDDNLFQFATSDFETNPFSLTPHQEDSTDSFLLDLSDYHPYHTTDAAGDYHPLLPATSVTAGPTALSEKLIEEDESDCFLKDDPCDLMAPTENFESFFDPVLEPALIPTTASSSSDVYPQTSETTNVGSPPNREDEEEEEETDDDPKPGTLNCKNLFSERNRRKRLSQQLLALRALVPNITKMDKRSVLVDALAYLKSIHDETARIEMEFKERSPTSRYNRNNFEPFPDNTPADTLLPSQNLAPLSSNSSKPKAQIVEIEVEKIEERRFVVKITCKGGAGIGGEVLRVIESLGFEITYTALEQIKPMNVLTTVFIRVKKQGRMTEEKLKDCITSTALRSGLMLQNP